MSNDRKYRVLVVDDEAAVLLTYRLILERQGYEVLACGTSVQAIGAGGPAYGLCHQGNG